MAATQLREYRHELFVRILKDLGRPKATDVSGMFRRSEFLRFLYQTGNVVVVDQCFNGRSLIEKYKIRWPRKVRPGDLVALVVKRRSAALVRLLKRVGNAFKEFDAGAADPKNWVMYIQRGDWLTETVLTTDRGVEAEIEVIVEFARRNGQQNKNGQPGQ